MNRVDRDRASPLHQPAHHDSGLKHTTGEAKYVDDMPHPAGMLVGLGVMSPHAHARLRAIDAEAARAVAGVHAVLLAEDIPGENLIGPIIHDEPVLAEGVVHYNGQLVAFVVGESYDACREAVGRVAVDYEVLPALLDVASARAAGAVLTEPHVIRRGDVDGAMSRASEVVTASTESGYQDHFYLETQSALAIPGEDGTVHVYSSTQHPTEVQKMVAHVLGVGDHSVVCEVPRMGGAFGGKESQATPYACLAALGARVTGRAVKVWLDRGDDMRQTGKRHPFSADYEAGFEEDGRLSALRVDIVANGGWSIDLTPAIVDRALFHLDNAYYLEHVDFVGQGVRTNLPSNTAFRGFGGPQGMLVVEEAINRYAERRGLDPAEVRRRNFYEDGGRDTTPYGQPITENRLGRIWDELMASSEYASRRAEIEVFNRGSGHLKRGIGFQPVKFGISFTKSILNQAGALVLVYADGTVQLNHGGTEMGQGLHTKMRAICADALGISVDSVRVMHTATDKVPNTSATAASSGSDLNGQAVSQACEVLRERMRPVAAELLKCEPAEVAFQGGSARDGGSGSVGFGELAQACWMRQISLSATGFYRTPGITYDYATGRGRPFYYFAYGGAVTDVEVSALTGEHRVRRVDILHDVGASLVPTIDRGQVEGAYVQGLGWLTCEEVLYGDDGRLLTPGPSTYKIPAIGDVPRDFRVELLARAPQPGVVHGSKAVGEPPFMLAISALTALRHAIQAIGTPGREVELVPPCTPEAILRAFEAQRS
jgi:xanthine dehydrogenase large subunit